MIHHPIIVHHHHTRVFRPQIHVLLSLYPTPLIEPRERYPPPSGLFHHFKIGWIIDDESCNR
jgi:hypothetical protein